MPQAVSFYALGDTNSSPHGITQVILFLLMPCVRLLLLILRTEERCPYISSPEEKVWCLQNTFRNRN